MSPGPWRHSSDPDRMAMASSLQSTVIWTIWQGLLPMQILQAEPERRGCYRTATTKAVKCCNIFNHDSWPEDQEDFVDHGADDLAFLLDHFCPVLTRNGVNTELAKEEFVGLKLLIARMFKDKTYLSLWELMKREKDGRKYGKELTVDVEGEGTAVISMMDILREVAVEW
ncbi:unnamed protein product [Merluccius merluccius]